jgi:hypothetical protein
VNLGVAKDQRLSLNPSQISGACGRLMCCLRYEHEFYAQSRKRFPKEGKALRTKRGEEKVVSNDIFRERVTLRGEDGEFRTIPLTELREEAEAAGAPLPLPVASAPAPLVVEDEAVDVALEVSFEEEVEPITVVEAMPEAESSDASSDESPADPREARPHRRRGRRGGRRNRPGGRRSTDAPDGSPPPASEG